MKYYLSLDKGQAFKNKERYINLELEKINELLNKDNNLKALTTFTCSFASAGELKDFLKAKGLIDTRNISYDVVITYSKDYIHFRTVPYSEDKKYLDYHNLEELICKFARKKGFLEAITRNYNEYPHLSREIYSFRAYLSNPYADYKLYDTARNFVGKICFREKNGTQVINYKGLFDLGMLVAKLTKPKKEPVQTIMPSVNIEKQYSEDDPAYHHLEELKSRYEKEQDDQMRLF